MSSTVTDTRGLAGQTIGETQICSVNQTQLIYRGYEIADLAANASFESSLPRTPPRRTLGCSLKSSLPPFQVHSSSPGA